MELEKLEVVLGDVLALVDRLADSVGVELGDAVLALSVWDSDLDADWLLEPEGVASL